MMDYALWEVIENGATLTKTQVVEGVTTVTPITSIEDKAQTRLEVKARSTLMMGISNKHQLKFNSIKDAKQLLKAIEKRFEMLDQTFNRLQKLRNKANLDTMSMDDLYNNFKIYEPEVKGMSSSNSSIQNMAFVSSSNNNSSSTNRIVNTAQAVNIANEVSTTSTQVNPAFSTNIDNLNDIEEMDLRWQMAMLTMRDRRLLKRTEKKLTVNGNEIIGFDKYNVKCYNCHKRGHFARGLNKLIECQIVDNCKKGLGYENYNAVPPPYIGNFMPPTLDLSYTGLDEFANKTVAENTKSSKKETKAVKKNIDASIIKEWVSHDEEKNVTQPKIEKKIVRPSIVKKEFVKPRQQEKIARKTVKKVEHNRQNIHRPRGNQRNLNDMMSQKL
nr:hypothetical protein [Tanacetum cinerariifolium]